MKGDAGEAAAMTAFITGLILGSIQDTLAKPITLLRCYPQEGSLSLQLASGMVTTIQVKVDPV